MQIKVVSKRYGLAPEDGWTDLLCDRKTPLGNPFVFEDESLRDASCDAHREWLWAIINAKPYNSVSLVPYILKYPGLKGYRYWKCYAAGVIQDRINGIVKGIKEGKKYRLVCWCDRRDEETGQIVKLRCHCDTLAKCVEWKLKQQIHVNR